MKNKTWQIVKLFSIFSIILFSSCAKLPVYESKNYIQSEKEDLLNPLSSNFDKKTNINFGIANNDTNIYIQATFHDRKSYMKIMRSGLVVYFDPTGKKGKDYQLKIERIKEQNIDLAFVNQKMRANPNAQQNDIVSAIEKSYNKVNWDKNGIEFIFYRNLQKDPIRVDLGSNELHELVLEIKMPIKEIPLETGSSLFSIGIESGSMPQKSMSNNQPSRMSAGSGNRGGGGGSGGRGGGQRGSGGSGKMGSGGQRPSGASPSGLEPVKLWFQVQL